MRTSAEAHIYMDQRPCTCGDIEFDRESAVMDDGGVLCSRYYGNCRSCGTMREFVFELPPTQRPITNQVEFGGADRSRLLDAGEWLAISEYYAKLDPGTPEDLDIARAALEEVIKFLPNGVESVPDSAFWSERGRAVRDREPGRFRRERLAAVLDVYRNLLAKYDVTDTPLVWQHSGSAEFPYTTDARGRRFTIRINDFPEESMYTLMAEGRELQNLEDWPAKWTMPDPPQELVDRLTKPAVKVEEPAEIDPTKDWNEYLAAIQRLHDAAAWKDLERTLRVGLRQVVGFSGELVGDQPRHSVEHELWRRLSVVYSKYLGEPRSAAMALEAAIRAWQPRAGTLDVVDEIRGLLFQARDRLPTVDHLRRYFRARKPRSIITAGPNLDRPAWAAVVYGDDLFVEIDSDCVRGAQLWDDSRGAHAELAFSACTVADLEAAIDLLPRNQLRTMPPPGDRLSGQPEVNGRPLWIVAVLDGDAVARMSVCFQRC